MPKQIKAVIFSLAVLAVLTAASTSANAAPAPRWKVNGAFLGNGAEKQFSATLKSGTKAELEVPKLGLNLVSENCSLAGRIVGSPPGVEGTVSKVLLACVEISVEGAEEVCSVDNVLTNNLSGNLGWMESTGSAVSVTAHPESASRIATVNIEGEECSFAGVFAVTGETAGGLFPPETEVATGELLVGPLTTIEHWFTPSRETMGVAGLQFNGNPARFRATLNASLTSGEKVGVFPG